MQFKVAVPEGQLGRQLGNTMSVNVIERVLARVLPAAQLSAVLPDRWEKGLAIKTLAATRGKGFLAHCVQAKKSRAKSGPKAVSEKAETKRGPPLSFAGEASVALKRALKRARK